VNGGTACLKRASRVSQDEKGGQQVRMSLQEYFNHAPTIAMTRNCLAPLWNVVAGHDLAVLGLPPPKALSLG
jgi:hypothetical protein